jgi:S1-C subfamily serine protease
VAALLVCALVGGVVGGALKGRLSPARPSVIGSQPPAPFAPSFPDPGSPAPAPQRSGGALDSGALAARLDPAVVDVNMTFAGGGQGAGTGMILTRTGEVLTNNHVVNGATAIRVQVGGTGPYYAAHVVGYDVTDDVALLQMEHASGLATVSPAAASSISIGEAVAAIGNALGRPGPPSITQGVVAALNQSLTVTDPSGQTSDLHGMIQTNVPLQPGDSGGPLVDASGKVVGMNTAASVRQRDASRAVGFAVPMDTALNVVRQIRSGQSSATVHVGPRALLGIVLQDGRRAAGTGAPVLSVEAGGPADKAGIAAGDVITSFANAAVMSPSDLTAAMDARRPGDKVAVGWVESSGQSHHAVVQLTSGPPR